MFFSPIIWYWSQIILCLSLVCTSAHPFLHCPTRWVLLARLFTSVVVVLASGCTLAYVSRGKFAHFPHPRGSWKQSNKVPADPHSKHSCLQINTFGVSMLRNKYKSLLIIRGISDPFNCISWQVLSCSWLFLPCSSDPTGRLLFFWLLKSTVVLQCLVHTLKFTPVEVPIKSFLINVHSFCR